MQTKAQRKVSGAKYYAAHREERLAYDVTYLAAHRDERRAYQVAYRAAHPGEERIYVAACARRYGLDAEQLGALGNACAVCGATANPDGHRLSVDHDHVTGRVRGKLCHGCNSSIGLMGENPQRLRAAANYLENNGKAS
jgi:hypothetical protein